MGVVFGLGKRLCVRKRTKFKKWRPSQRTATTECCDQGEFETLSGWEAVRCDEHPFHAKIKMSA